MQLAVPVPVHGEDVLFYSRFECAETSQHHRFRSVFVTNCETTTRRACLHARGEPRKVLCTHSAILHQHFVRLNARAAAPQRLPLRRPSSIRDRTMSTVSTVSVPWLSGSKNSGFVRLKTLIIRDRMSEACVVLRQTHRPLKRRNGSLMVSTREFHRRLDLFSSILGNTAILSNRYAARNL